MVTARELPHLPALAGAAPCATPVPAQRAVVRELSQQVSKTADDATAAANAVARLSLEEAEAGRRAASAAARVREKEPELEVRARGRRLVSFMRERALRFM